MRLRTVTSLDEPGLEPYRSLRARGAEDDRFVAEGEKVIRALLASSCRVVSVLLAPSWLGALRDTLGSERFADTDVLVGSEVLLTGIVGFNMHQNLLALARVPENLSPADVAAAAGPGSLTVALENVTDAENMGMLLRNCAAFGVATLLVGPDSASPFLRRSVRVSLGTVLSVRIHRSDTMFETLAMLKAEHRWHITGTVPRGGSAEPFRDRERPRCLLFGNEAHGLTEDALALCDDLFSIPMAPGVDSLNIANAAAVALYAASAGR